MGNPIFLADLAKEVEEKFKHYEAILVSHGIQNKMIDYGGHDGNELYLKNKKYENVFVKDIDNRQKLYLIDNNVPILANGKIQEKNELGHITRTMYFKRGLLHNDKSYAYIEHYLVGTFQNGKNKYAPQVKSYYLNGYELTLEKFWEKQKNTKYAAEICANVFGDK